MKGTWGKAQTTRTNTRKGGRWRPWEDVSWGRNPAASDLRGPSARLGGEHRGSGCVPQPCSVVEARLRGAEPEERESGSGRAEWEASRPRPGSGRGSRGRKGDPASLAWRPPV